jgi:Cytidylyltransferase-like
MTTGAYPGSFNPPTRAHLAIAQAAVRQLGLDRLDLIVSRVALGKEGVERPQLQDRLMVLEEVAASRPWLGALVTDHRLLADVAAGYDVVVMGADKWAQVVDPAWYGGSAAARDEAVARLPRVVVAPRPGYDTVGVHVLDVDPDHLHVSSTAARSHRADWMVPEAAAFDARTGAWTDPARYDRWLRAIRPP